MKMIIVSGQSGAGKSVALRVLEDLGYYCVDNLPVNLLDQFIKAVDVDSQNIAVSIDIRNLPKNAQDISMIIEKLKQDHDVKVLFLDAEEKTLLKRYSETRRLHPLSMNQGQCTLEQAIYLEKNMLLDIKEQADLFVDTTHQSLHDLSETIRVRLEGKQTKDLVMVFESFGYKFGLPQDADFVFDVRFLPNPHWIPELRAHTGLEQPVIEYLSQQDDVNALAENIITFIERWLPALQTNNRSYLTVAIGCTGGKHRSVYLTQTIGEYFKAKNQQVQIRHTTLEKSKALTSR